MAVLKTPVVSCSDVLLDMDVLSHVVGIRALKKVYFTVKPKATTFFKGFLHLYCTIQKSGVSKIIYLIKNAIFFFSILIKLRLKCNLFQLF